MAGAGLAPDAGRDSVDAVKESVSTNVECHGLSPVLLSTSGALVAVVLVAVIVVVVVDLDMLRLSLPVSGYH